jgi:hypothetical protein
VPRVHFRFHRSEQLARRIWECAEHSLAANDHDVVVSDRSRRSDEMLKLRTVHATARTISRILPRSGSLRVPANGEAWRRSAAAFSSVLIALRISSNG